MASTENEAPKIQPTSRTHGPTARVTYLDIAALRDGRLKSLFQPSTRHGNGGRPLTEGRPRDYRMRSTPRRGLHKTTSHGLDGDCHRFRHHARAFLTAATVSALGFVAASAMIVDTQALRAGSRIQVKAAAIPGAGTEKRRRRGRPGRPARRPTAPEARCRRPRNRTRSCDRSTWTQEGWAD
jgi:hypothetical protein